MKTFQVMLASVLFAGMVHSVRAQNPKECPGLTGQARMKCLEAKMVNKNAAMAAANARMARANANMKRACDLYDGVNAIAPTVSAAGAISRLKPLEFGGMVWTSTAEFMSYLTKSKRNCADARRAVEASRKGG